MSDQEDIEEISNFKPTRGKNAFGLTAKQMQKVYHDDITTVLENPVNAHIHWFNKKGYCNICSEKYKKEVI